MSDIITSHNIIYLLDKNYQVIGITNYMDYNHISRDTFEFCKIENYIFHKSFKIKVFKRINLNSGLSEDVFFEIGGIKFKCH